MQALHHTSPRHHRELSSRKAAEPVSTPNGTSILVVDDEPQIVDFLASLLEEEGYRVKCAHDGLEAMGVIRNDKPELVISDVMMPSVSGLELLRRIENSGLESTPKMILMSAVGKPRMAKDVAFLQKPFDIDDLLTIINGELGNEQRISH